MSDNITSTQIKAAESTVKQSLQFLDDSKKNKSDLALEFNQKVQEMNLTVNKMNEISAQLLQTNIDDEDKRRLTLGLNTRGVQTYKDKYANQPDILALYEQYSHWSSTLGFEPPSFTDGVTGGSLSYLRKGTLSDLKDNMGQIASIDNQVSGFQFKLADAVNNATNYKTKLQDELQNTQNIIIASDDPQKDLKQQVKDIAVKEITDRVDLWQKVEDFVSVQKTDDGYTFNNLNYAATPIEPLSYDVGRVYFNATIRTYYIELWFSAIVDRKYVISDTAIDYYTVEPGLLLDTVNFVTETDEFGNTSINYQKVVLSTKFGIIPNESYVITVEIPTLENTTITFERKVGPKIKAVDYIVDNQIHIKFTAAEIDIDTEGIRDDTRLILNKASASNMSNYSLNDILGNSVAISYIFVEDDLSTVTVCLEDSMTNRMGYAINIENLLFENGNGMMGTNGQFNFVYSDPYPIAGLTGLYDTTTSVVALIWVPTVQDGMAGYNIYRKEEHESIFTKINASVLIDEKSVDSNIEIGKSYNYYITVVDLSGDESVPSSIFNVVAS